MADMTDSEKWDIAKAREAKSHAVALELRIIEAEESVELKMNKLRELRRSGEKVELKTYLQTGRFPKWDKGQNRKE
jgi:hypothetical protein